MNRLQSELHRLYLPRPEGHAEGDAQSAVALIDPRGMARTMVMELARPPSWAVLSTVWHGVQTELELPAPAIAVSGVDGLQLWFSLDAPILVAQAHAFLEHLRSRFLPEIQPSRLRLMPVSDASAPRHAVHARLVPALQEQNGNWSAFVAPDLAPVFADTPWLDIAPNDEGQAALLSGLDVTKQAVFEAALKKLEPRAPPLHSVAATADEPATPERPMVAAAAAAADADADPKRFLRQVMNDETVALTLRIDAAKALLQHSSDHRPPQRD